MHLRTLLKLLTTLLILVLSGCATITLGERTTADKLKTFAPAPGWVSLYVCREQAYLVAAGVRSRILVDNDEIGVLKTNMFAHVWLAPGKHGVLVRNDGLASGTGGLETFEAKPGETVYYWVGVTGGGFGTLTIDKFDEISTARACVTKAVYAAGRTGATPPSAGPVQLAPATAEQMVAPSSATAQVPIPQPLQTPKPVPTARVIQGGQDSYQAERLTEVKACAAQPQALLTAKGPGFETYKVDCQNGDVLIVRCELGTCRVLK